MYLARTVGGDRTTMRDVTGRDVDTVPGKDLSRIFSHQAIGGGTALTAPIPRTEQSDGGFGPRHREASRARHLSTPFYF